MKKVEETISTMLNIPCISEEDTIDKYGCFMLVPVLTSGISGDGTLCTYDDNWRIHIFKQDKSELIRESKKVFKHLAKEKKVVVDTPSYTYEKEWKVWRAMITIIMIGGSGDE